MTIRTYGPQYAFAVLTLAGMGTLSATALNAQTAQPLPTAAQTDPKTLA